MHSGLMREPSTVGARMVGNSTDYSHIVVASNTLSLIATPTSRDVPPEPVLLTQILQSTFGVPDPRRVYYGPNCKGNVACILVSVFGWSDGQKNY
jgi:hypothetical protein